MTGFAFESMLVDVPLMACPPAVPVSNNNNNNNETALNLTRERPCGHNEWICTDRRKNYARLRCIACGAKWKMVLEWFEKCPEFHAEPSKSCPRGAACPHPHIYARSRKGDAPSQRGLVQSIDHSSSASPITSLTSELTRGDSVGTMSSLPTPKNSTTKKPGSDPYDSSHDEVEQEELAAVALQLQQQMQLQQQQQQLAAMLQPIAGGSKKNTKKKDKEADNQQPMMGMAPMGMMPVMPMMIPMVGMEQVQMMQTFQQQQMQQMQAMFPALMPQKQQKTEGVTEEAKEGGPSVLHLLAQGMRKGSPSPPPTSDASREREASPLDVFSESLRGTVTAAQRSTLNVDAPVFVPSGLPNDTDKEAAAGPTCAPEPQTATSTPEPEPQDVELAQFVDAMDAAYTAGSAISPADAFCPPPLENNDSDSDSDSEDEILLQHGMAY
eukprot:TRINITY_DN259_c2_g2_i1.p1 TRINITY_DN259_c2_g2~~TRINITY_DN259_c2_g2_i1.p1  ORF type:complete len:439 (+),score=115.29 TRINITY_DN259_c2_g2_i1:85-1401(+)